MKRSPVVFGIAAMLAGTSLVGCKLMDDEFAGSVPTAENVALAVPASTQSALTAGDGTKVSALLGEEAGSYQLTRAVTGIVNGRAWHHYFVGQVQGDRISGEVTVSDGNNKRSLPWTATRTK